MLKPNDQKEKPPLKLTPRAEVSQSASTSGTLGLPKDTPMAKGRFKSDRKPTPPPRPAPGHRGVARSHDGASSRRRFRPVRRGWDRVMSASMAAPAPRAAVEHDAAALLRGVLGVHQQSASRPTRNKRPDIMHPRIIRPDMSAADQEQLLDSIRRRESFMNPCPIAYQ